MKARLIILIVAAGGLAVYYAVGKNSKTPSQAAIVNNDGGTESGMSEDELRATREMQETLDKFPLPGNEPADPPDVNVVVRVDTSEGKNRLYFTISESHGYYVEQFGVRFWYKDTPETEYDDSPLTLGHFVDRYLKANDTLTDCIEVVPAELRRVGGDIGASENWGATVFSHGRAREANPDTFRARQPSTCGP